MPDQNWCLGSTKCLYYRSKVFTCYVTLRWRQAQRLHLGLWQRYFGMRTTHAQAMQPLAQCCMSLAQHQSADLVCSRVREYARSLPGGSVS